MHNLTFALTAILMLGLAAFLAPNILALNRGKVLRNIALWLAIFAGLGLVYQAVYGDHPPAAMQKLMRNMPSMQQDEAPSQPDKNGNKDFTPPGE